MMKKFLKQNLVFLIIASCFAFGVITFMLPGPEESFSVNALIQTPINTSVDNTSWTAISLGAAQRCTSFVAKTRNSDDWKMSDSSSGTKYITIDGSSAISVDITGREGQALFYVQTATGVDTIELLITR